MDEYLAMRLLNHARAERHTHQQRFWRTVELLSSSATEADQLPSIGKDDPMIINPSPTLISFERAVQMNWEAVVRHGGSAGVRGDDGECRLRYALEFPLMGYYRTLEEQAAHMFEKIACRHPFVDGNKRTAYAVTYEFIDRHGYVWNADPLETYRMALALCTKQITVDDVVAFIAAHLERIV